MQKLTPIGALFSQTIALYKKCIKDLIQPLIIMIIPTLLMTLVLLVNIPGQMLIYGLLTIANIVISLWIALVIIEAVNKSFLNQPIKLDEIYSPSFKKIPSYLLIAILTGLIVLGGLILLIVPGIIFSIWYGFALYIFLFDGTKGYAALKKSKELVVGYTWPIFGRYILATIIMYIVGFGISFILSLPFGGMNFTQSTTASSIFSVFTTIIFTLIAPLLTGMTIIIYYNLKKLKSSPASAAAAAVPPTNEIPQ